MQDGTTTFNANEWPQYAATNAHEWLDRADTGHDNAAALRKRCANDGKILRLNKKCLSCTFTGTCDEYATTTLRGSTTTSNGVHTTNATDATTTTTAERTRHDV